MSERAHQATVVAIAGRGLMIEGPSGSGKSSLALALIDRGAVLVGDDGVMIEAGDGRLLARPHPATRGLLEVREVGLLEFPVCASAPIALVIRLDMAAARFREGPDFCDIANVRLPLVVLRPDSPILAIKAELAFAHHALSCD